MIHARMILTLLSTLAIAGLALAGPPKEARLNYQQEQLLKDATYYLDQVEGNLDIIDEKSKGMKPGDASVQIQDVDRLIGLKDQLSKYLTNVETRFQQLPLDHSKVKPEVTRHAALKDRLAATMARLAEVKGGLDKVVGQGSGAGYKADFDRLKDINQMYGNPQILNTHPEQAVDVLKQVGAVKAERQRIAEKYADLLKQSTPQATDMNNVLKYFDEQFGKFDKAAQQYAAAAPGEINQNLDQAITMGKDGVANQNHLFFRDTGGVNQRIERAQTYFNVLEAISSTSPDVAACKSRIESTRAEVKQMKASLNDAIIAANTVPEQKYNDADKDELVGIVKTKWQSAGVGGDVLKMGINSQNWRRDTRWEWDHDAWHKIDKSRIQGFVIVKFSDTQAVIHYVNLVKDHLAEDRIDAYFFDDPKAAPEVNHLMLLSNVK